MIVDFVVVVIVIVAVSAMVVVAIIITIGRLVFDIEQFVVEFQGLSERVEGSGVISKSISTCNMPPYGGLKFSTAFIYADAQPTTLEGSSNLRN